MKNVRNNALKVVMLIALFTPAAFADGDMGGGGFVEYDNPTKTTRTGEGDMGGGGRTASVEIKSYLDALIDSVCDYFDAMI